MRTAQQRFETNSWNSAFIAMRIYDEVLADLQALAEAPKQEGK